MSAHGTFCTVFDCMDGRCQALVAEWCKRELRAEYPDTITIAGCDGVLAADEGERGRAFRMARISAEKHGARQAVVVGHSECAGYPVSDEDHKKAIARDAALIRGSGIFENVTGLFVDVQNKTIERV